MQVDPFQPLTSQTQPMVSTARQTPFNEYLSKATPSRLEADETTAQDPHESARQAARSLVAIGLIHPVLKKLRESNQAWGPFAPNNAERSFGAVMDQRLADQMVQARNWPLIEQITNRLLQNAPGGMTAGSEGATR